MMRWRHPPELERRREGRPFDPVAEGARHGLSRELSLVIWGRIQAEAIDGLGRRAAGQAELRFHEVARRIAARGGAMHHVGKVTRVGVELNGDLHTSVIDELAVGTPGKATLTSTAHHRLLASDAPAALADPGQVMTPPGRTGEYLATAAFGGEGNATASRSGAALLRQEAAAVRDLSDPAVTGALDQQGGGVPLSDSLRRLLELQLGVRFDRVRIHTDAVANAAARALGARAFTIGEDVYFAEGAFTNTATSIKLLAHELTHVLQYYQGRIATSATVTVSHPSDPLEREAESTAAQVMFGTAVAPRTVARKADAPRLGEPRSGMVRAIHRFPPDGGVASEPSDAGVGDASESLPGGVPPTAAELQSARLADTPPGELRDDELGPALEQATVRANQPRTDAIVAEIHRRNDDRSFGVGLPGGLPRGSRGGALVTPEIALEMIQNMIEGRPPFRPELGVGGVSWFVTEGEPYTGVSANHTIPVQTELIDTEGGLRFEQADLDRIYAQEEASARPEVEAQVRAQFRLRTGRDAPPVLSRTLADAVARQLRGLAERRMWTRIGELVARSPRRVGEVILPAGGRFSRLPGRFRLVADASRIRVRGGVRALLDAVRASPSVQPVPALEGSVEELARTLRAAGRVRSAFRIGGRILIVVAIAVDVYEIVIAEDHLEATLVSLSGWAGAAAGATAFSALWTPADVAGPWAWAAHGVGALVAGGIGYWAGSSTTRYVYRLIVRSRGRVDQ